MNNKFINNNGVNLLNTSKKPVKKTKVESQIETLKQQEQAIVAELERWETKQKKADKLVNYLDEVDRFSTKFLAEAVKAEQAKENRDDWWLEYSIRDKVEFDLKFEPATKAFTDLICQKIANQTNYLKSQLGTIQNQLAHQERIFARIEVRRQGRKLLTCEYKKSIGCFGSYQCANCQSNYSLVANNQTIEITK